MLNNPLNRLWTLGTIVARTLNNTPHRWPHLI